MMHYYEISYYRTRNWIDKKYVKSEIGATAAIRKTKLKEICDCAEISEQDYLKYKQREIDRKNLARVDSFIETSK